MDYFFGTVPGSVLIQEPALRAVLITFVIATILGAGIGFMARRLRTSSGVAKHQVRRLGSWLFWMGAIALGLSLFFYEDALFTKRIWLYLMLALVYAVGYYALYFYFTQYPGLVMQERAERERRRPYTPAPATLAAGRQTTTTLRTREVRRRRRVR